eukprot:scaffold49887_cov71-Cyclotella_meneghiniana.AAC.4
MTIFDRLLAIILSYSSSKKNLFHVMPRTIRLLYCICGVALIASSSGFAPSTCTLTNRSGLKRLHKVSLGESTGESNDTGITVERILESLPSTDTIAANLSEGKLGERGEQYVIAQFGLLLFITIGNVPFIGDAFSTLLGPTLLLTGLFAVYKSAADLQDNLSPWPVPTSPTSGRGSLINSGIYSYVRHPMYTGVLLGMVGLSIVTDSVVRLLLTCALYYVLDVKSEYEETKLVEIYGEEYESYKQEVEGKFFPADWKNVF